ncbi:MAG: TraR/DksA family transcriptional regulator [Gammaproteobacteria bacterium]|nr:TraR/DksA family transcriptional regulator [Gammaproteobacteria bacterium]
MRDTRQSTADPRQWDDSERLTDAQRETLKSMLEKYRRQLLAQLGDTGLYGTDPLFTGERDVGPHALENAEISVELQEHAKLDIELIDAALKRLDLGSYGRCCDCGNAIGFARLQAHPTARRCIACKRVYEQHQ